MVRYAIMYISCSVYDFCFSCIVGKAILRKQETVVIR
jgi:hypothetical protein